MITKQDLLSIMEKEFATTIKVLEAYPEGQDSFRPHERSSDAMKLVSTFVFEMYLLDGYLFGEKADPAKFKNYKPANVKAAISDFKNETNAIKEKMEKMSDDELNKVISFAGRTFTGVDFAFMMICDQIHHRGQLSVYIRMAGGLVPSIYGPSADDNSTNL
ncbi:MAG: DinB family protein [Patescibacteria group bacterium]